MSQTKAECLAAAGDAYGAILADPVRREEIREHMAAYNAARAAESNMPASAGEQPADTTRKSA